MAARSSRPPSPTSDKATSAFIRRTLAPHLAHADQSNNNVTTASATAGTRTATPKPVEDLLPPLTSSNEIDLQLYGILAVIIKDSVQTWYAKITQDRAFVDETIQTIAHCTRALEQRVRRIDVVRLIGDDVVALIESHYDSYRISHRPLQPPPLTSHPRGIYHQLHPHPALSPVPSPEDPEAVAAQAENEAAWRQLLVQSVLAVLLPTEDLENACLRALVTDIFSEIILKNIVMEMVCQNWVLWDWIAKAAKEAKSQTSGRETKAQQPKTRKSSLTSSKLEQFGLLSSHNSDESPGETHSKPSAQRTSSLATTLWSYVAYVFMAFGLLRSLVVAFIAAHRGGDPDEKDDSISPLSATASSTVTSSKPRRKAILDLRIWCCASRVLELSDRMPWLTGVLALAHHILMKGPGKIGEIGGVLDSFLAHTLQTHLHSSQIAPALAHIRRILLPRNSLPSGSNRTAPSPPQQARLKRRAAKAVLAAMPAHLRNIVFASGGVSTVEIANHGTSADVPQPNQPETTETNQENAANEAAVDDDDDEFGASEDGFDELDNAQCRDVERTLIEPLEDPYLNKHLAIAIVELVLVRILPEIGEQGAGELIEERLG